MVDEVLNLYCFDLLSFSFFLQFCVRNMSKIDTAMKSLLAAMKKRPDCVNSAAESISKMMEEGSPELVLQALEHGMVAYLLELLDSALTECDKPSATKAIIAESLKLMAKDLANGERVWTITTVHMYMNK